MTPEEKNKILNDLGGIPEETYDSLVVELVKEIEKHLLDLRVFAANKDSESLLKLLHMIKGSAGNFRLIGVQHAAEFSEHVVRDKGNTKHVKYCIERIAREIELFKSNFHTQSGNGFNQAA